MAQFIGAPNARGPGSIPGQGTRAHMPQLRVFIGRSDAEAEASKLWPPNVKSRLIRIDPDAGKD